MVLATVSLIGWCVTLRPGLVSPAFLKPCHSTSLWPHGQEQGCEGYPDSRWGRHFQMVPIQSTHPETSRCSSQLSQACSAAISLLSLPRQAPQTRCLVPRWPGSGLCPQVSWSVTGLRSAEAGRGPSPWLCPQDSGGPVPAASSQSEQSGFAMFLLLTGSLCRRG